MSNWDDWNGLVASENRFDSPNKNERAASITKPTHIVIHITGTNDYQTVHNRFMNSSQKASAHYVIKKDGTITQYVRDKYRAYHAGILSHIKTLYDFNDGRWKKYLRYFNWFTGYPANAKHLKSDLSIASSESERALVTTADSSNWHFYDFWEQRHKNLQCPVHYQQNKDPNSYSIGIELLTVGGKTKDKYEDGLYAGLDRLLTDLCQKYEIPRDREHIIGHEDVNPVERWGWDPNSGFDWDRALAISTQNSWYLPLAISDGLECTGKSISNLYRHTEQEFPGGYFPVGANTTWHGGIHLLGNPSQTVHAMADGTVVCARMPKADPQQASLKYGSRNFVLIRHGQGAETWYSLYYHLKSIDPASSEAEEIAWLKCRALEFTNTRNFRTIPDTEQGSEIIREFAKGDKAEIISEDGDWLEVQDPKTQRVGFVKFSAERMKKIDSVSVDLQARFSNGDAVHSVNRSVRAGDIIGYLGEGVTLEGSKVVSKPILHWEVFSPSLHKGNWTAADDPDHDFTCDNKAIIDLVEKGATQSGGVFRVDGKLCANEIVAFYKNEENARKLRPYACKFRAEWSVDWKAAEQKLSANGYTPRTDTLSLYNFWSDATKHDKTLPADGHVWHYNPIAFIEKQLHSTARATILADSFEPDRTLPLPGKISPVLKKIGEYLASNQVKASLIIGHAGVQGDSQDATALSKTRADALSWILTLNTDAISAHLRAGKWGNRERKIMLGHFKDSGGKSYFTGTVDDTASQALTAAVRKFQEDNKLAVDGDAGRATFTKMFELMLKAAGMEKFSACECIGAGQNHATPNASKPADGGSPEPTKVAEILLWSSEISPASADYSAKPEETYRNWVQAVAVEIGDKAQSDSPTVVGDGIWFENDPENSLWDDDQIILETADGTVVQSVRIKDKAEEKNGFVLLKFDKGGQGKQYNLKFDTGEGGFSYYIARNVEWDYFMQTGEENATTATA